MYHPDMKSLFPIRCKCGQEMVLETAGTDSFKDTSCPHCHSAIWVVDNGFVSTRVLNKSLIELHSGDFTLSIIFCAMAVECELARVFVKWKEIDLGVPTDVTQADRDSWEEQLRQWAKIVVRLDRVCEFLTGQIFNTFVTNRTKLVKSIQERHPESTKLASLKKFFEEGLFWKRNAIVHLGKIDFELSEAEVCRRIAETLFQIISEMDFTRLQRLEAKL